MQYKSNFSLMLIGFGVEFQGFISVFSESPVPSFPPHTQRTIDLLLYPHELFYEWEMGCLTHNKVPVLLIYFFYTPIYLIANTPKETM